MIVTADRHRHHRCHSRHYCQYFGVAFVLISIFDIGLVSLSNLMERYSHRDINHYRELMFDVNNYQLIVGARDYLLRVRLEGFQESAEPIYLPADQEKQKLCERKGMKRWQCRNYITVLMPLHATKQVLICGTNAFAPECQVRHLSSLLTVVKQESAISKSAFSPLWNSTSLLITQSGDYFYAGPLDFRGIDAAIIRHSPTTPAAAVTTMSSSARKSTLRTLQSDSKWINADANFVASFEHDRHVYFLFRESAVEYINCGKSIYSRVGRVCKNDIGGQLYYRDNWTSFAKSRLNCSIPGLFPFYFDELQSVHWLDTSDVPTIYAIFNTPENSIHGSAVCAYRMDSVLASFHGHFKRQKDTHSAWESANVANRDAFECHVTPLNASEPYQSELLNSQYQLMDMAVQPVNGRPYIVHTEKQFRLIAVDVIQSKHHNSVEVIFVATGDGTLLKYVQWPFSTSACLVDQIQVIDKRNEHQYNTNNNQNSHNESAGDSILSMKLLKDTQSLYIGTQFEIIRVPLHRCHEFVTRQQCLDSGDPYCGWNEMKMACGTAPGRNPHSTQWIQSDSTVCPKSAADEWGDWFDCSQLNVTRGDRCLCRARPCVHQSSYLCSANGFEVQVANCTQHGVWSEWSPWSACSATCGLANKYRLRKCASPAPAFGGHQCTGREREEVPCLNLPPCVNLSIPIETAVPKQQLPQQPRWSEWSQWEKCSVKCGGGIQLRRRRLEWPDSRQQQQKGGDCFGCDVEWRICNSHDCQGVRQQSEWTDWLVKNITGDGVIEQRVKFTCRAQMGDTASVNIQSRIEERFIASQLPSWSLCTHDGCNGWQFKWNGDSYIRRECMSSECMGWSQWTQWSQCASGAQSRSRECDGTVRCNGHYKEMRYCSDSKLMSDANDDNHPQLNSVLEKPAKSSPKVDRSDIAEEPSFSIKSLIVWCVMSFVCGSAVTGVVIYLFIHRTDRLRDMRNQRLSLRLFSSSSLKHSSSANAYVSPQDYKLNHNNHNHSALLSPLTNGSLTPPVREATIKRSSTIRAKLHSDQNF